MEQCICCLAAGHAEVDPTSHLCVYCQPCPSCGVTGSACTDDICYPPTPPTTP